jgi:fructose-bisphosphate aldolase class II
MSGYRKTGLVPTGEMFAKALRGGYAVPAYNFINMEQLQAVVHASLRSKSPVILQVSKNILAYAGPELVRNIPVALNLDHGDSFELCASCIEDGFSSVMIDGSAFPLEKNITLTRKVVEYAHERDVAVEGELGVLSGVEDDVTHADSLYTDPRKAEEFVRRTGIDSLAVSIGNAHGVVKFRMKEGAAQAPLRLDILEEIERRLPDFPIVLHGASQLPETFVRMINAYGGRIESYAGIPEEQVRQAVRGAVCKVNIASDAFLVFTALVRKMLSEKPENFDPRKYLGPARETLIEEYVRKNREVFGSAGKA